MNDTALAWQDPNMRGPCNQRHLFVQTGYACLRTYISSSLYNAVGPIWQRACKGCLPATVDCPLRIGMPAATTASYRGEPQCPPSVAVPGPETLLPAPAFVHIGAHSSASSGLCTALPGRPACTPCSSVKSMAEGKRRKCVRRLVLLTDHKDVNRGVDLMSFLGHLSQQCNNSDGG